MRLWKRAAGALKDGQSLFKASLTRRSTLRNPDIEAAVIRATSHDDSYIDCLHAQCVFAWLRVSGIYLRPVLYAISHRLRRTQNWAVALKGLMLMHGVFCCKVPAVQKIGRLPFDLSNFKDGYSTTAETWSFEAFIRAYYAYLDQKSSFLFVQLQEPKAQKTKKDIVHRDIVWLQKLQCLLDLLMDIKPKSDAKTNPLVLEAMDCIVIEVFDVYSRICNGIASILVRIYSAGIEEAKMTLDVLEKATIQGVELSDYFRFCKKMGVVNASECPKIEHISQAYIQELENLIKASSSQSETEGLVSKEEKKMTETNGLKTIVTNDWEVFEDDKKKDEKRESFGERNKVELPDLISF